MEDLLFLPHRGKLAYPLPLEERAPPSRARLWRRTVRVRGCCFSIKDNTGRDLVPKIFLFC